MRGTTFGAHLALIDGRWQWPDGAEEAKRDYRDRLWAKVCDWTGRQVDAFKAGVERLIADPKRFGRPSVEDVVDQCRAQERRAAPPTSPEEEERERQLCDCIYTLRVRLDAGNLGAASTLEQASAFGGWPASAVRWAWQRLVFWRECRCGFGIALRLGLKVETTEDDRGRRGSSRTAGAWYRCLGCRHREPVFDTRTLQGVEIDAPAETAERDATRREGA